MTTLAIFGGQPAVAVGCIPAWPSYGKEEEAAVQRVVASRKWWRGAGDEVEQFEREFADFHTCRYALAVCNGTQAIEIALACLGVGYGDEVIIPAFTFVATATAVLTVGACPIAVDVDLNTYCMDPAAVLRAITPRTKAIIPVHLAGLPCDMDRLEEISRQAGIPILSDSAHAHGARWRGQSLASLSAASIYSFQAVKLMTAGEGGAIVTDSKEIAEQAWLRHTYGRPRGDRNYQHLCLGTNSRMTEFQGAILRCQLERLKQLLRVREEGADRLDRGLSDIPGLEVASRYEGATQHSHYMYMVRVSDSFGISRNQLVDALVAEGVPAYRAYPSIPDLEMFRLDRLRSGDVPLDLSAEWIRDGLSRHSIANSRRISSESLWLHHPVLMGGPEVQDAVVSAFRKIAESREKLKLREDSFATAR